jgi:hypothetical protein
VVEGGFYTVRLGKQVSHLAVYTFEGDAVERGENMVSSAEHCPKNLSPSFAYSEDWTAVVTRVIPNYDRPSSNRKRENSRDLVLDMEV